MASVIDEQSATWRAVQAWAEGRLASSRATLEAPGTPLDMTENHRGRIAVLKELLRLPKPSRIPSHYSADAAE